MSASSDAAMIFASNLLFSRGFYTFSAVLHCFLHFSSFCSVGLIYYTRETVFYVKGYMEIKVILEGY